MIRNITGILSLVIVQEEHDAKIGQQGSGEAVEQSDDTRVDKYGEGELLQDLIACATNTLNLVTVEVDGRIVFTSMLMRPSSRSGTKRRTLGN